MGPMAGPVAGRSREADRVKLTVDNQCARDLTEEVRAIQEVAAELHIELLPTGGLPLTLKPTDEGLRLEATSAGYTLAFANRSALLRGFGLLAELCGQTARSAPAATIQPEGWLPDNCFSLAQTPAFRLSGPMVDCSRNAVLTVAAIKRLCRILALMGHNCLMLYTEDTYEIPGRPYFGYMRGRYTQAELQDCDQYAKLLGIELVPCIQTLAHLNAALRWPEFARLKDCDDILLADDEATYQLIEDMLASLSQSLSSRRIHIGMDEAHMLGLGEHLRRHGYQDPSDIMLRHLQKVVALCSRYDYQPMMWSDMFFRLCHPDYYSAATEISEAVIKLVPPQVTLTYWDYYHTDKAVYDYMIEKHQHFHNPLLFAGGAWSWHGLLPLNRFSLASSRPALQSLREHGVDQVLVTAWGDNGGSCPVFSVMPTLQLYAEASWTADCSDSQLARRLQTCAGMDWDSFMMLEQPHDVPGRSPDDVSTVNPARYELLQDPLCGLLDRHVSPGSGQHYAACATKLAACQSKNPRWAYLFATAVALCRVLELKSELGIRLKQAYDQQDRSQLQALAKGVLPDLCQRLAEFKESFYRQWTTDNKIFGFDVQELRLGGLEARLTRTRKRLLEYLNVTIPVLEELEQDRLFYDGRAEGENAALPLAVQNWALTASAGVI